MRKLVKYSFGIFLTPSLTTTKIWKVIIKVIMRILGALPRPSKTIKIGKKTILGKGYKMEIKGIIKLSIFSFLPMRIPRGTAILKEISALIRIRYKEMKK